MAKPKEPLGFGMGLSVRRLPADYGEDPKECQWPFGDPGKEDFYFCGAPVCTGGTDYCDKHLESSRVEIEVGTTPKKPNSKTPLRTGLGLKAGRDFNPKF